MNNVRPNWRLGRVMDGWTIESDDGRVCRGQGGFARRDEARLAAEAPALLAALRACVWALRARGRGHSAPNLSARDFGDCLLPHHLDALRKGEEALEALGLDPGGPLTGPSPEALQRELF